MSDFNKITETSSNHDHLEQMSALELLQKINEEDQKVALAVQQCIPQIEKLVSEIEEDSREVAAYST